MRALQLDGLTKIYGRRLLFQDVSASVAPGQTLIVTGANGAGKSTLLRIVAGLTRPDEGAVRLLDMDGPARLGYAAPDVHPYAELTAAENLAFFRRLRGLADDGKEDAELLARVGLGRARGGDPVGAYSSGMRQRLRLALSLLGEPPVLLWDEPTATLDGNGEARVEDILAAHGAAGGLAVIATNDADEAERWGSGAGPRIHIGR